MIVEVGRGVEPGVVGEALGVDVVLEAPGDVVPVGAEPVPVVPWAHPVSASPVSAIAMAVVPVVLFRRM
ncbi:hypothetical protein J2X60_001739 [Curtobacterium sp. 320]|nr:hypothetical protein [Curtobacterium sp. 320]